MIVPNVLLWKIIRYTNYNMPEVNTPKFVEINIVEDTSSYKPPKEPGARAAINLQSSRSFRSDVLAKHYLLRQQQSYFTDEDERLILSAAERAQKHILSMPETEFNTVFREFMLEHEIQHHYQEAETGAMSLIQRLNTIRRNICG